MYTTTSVNYDNNIKQDMDKDINNMEVIPDNNFEDGFENSEIIELNDTTIDDDEEEFVKRINPQIPLDVTPTIIEEMEIHLLL